MIKYWTSIVLLGITLTGFGQEHNPLAFPGAEGFGKYTSTIVVREVYVKPSVAKKRVR
jgi:hypothetical protein